MIIKIKIFKLINMIKNISGAIKNKKKESILSYILIKIIENKIFCIAINEEIELVTYDEYENYIQDIEVLIKYDFISEICKKNNLDSYIYIKKNKNLIEIKVNDAYFTLPNTLTEIFPSFYDKNEKINNFKINSYSLKNLLYYTKITLSENNTKLFLNGMFIEINENIITAFSCDGNRFTFSYDFISNNNKNAKIIIPKQTVNEIINIANTTENIYITLTKKYIRFITSKITLTSILINDIYDLPSIKLDKNFFINIKLNKEKIKKSIYKINFLIKENKITFDIINEKIKILTENRNEKAYITVNAENMLKQNITININCKYLMDIIKYIENNNFNFICSKKKKFIIIKEKIKKYIYIMLPL